MILSLLYYNVKEKNRGGTGKLTKSIYASNKYIV